MERFLVEDSWGVASLRQCAGYVSNDLYFAPLSSCLVKWDIKSKQCKQVQLHSDLITNLILSNNNIVLSVGFCGEVRLWNHEYNLLANFQCSTENIIYGSWSDDGKEFSICSKGPKQMVVVYNFENVVSQYNQKSVVDYKWFYKAPQSTNSGERWNGHNENQQLSYDCFNVSLFKENFEVIAIYQSSDICELFLFSPTGDILKKSAVSPLGDEKNVMLCTSDINKNYNLVAIGLQHGVFGFYDTCSLEVHVVLQATGSPQICLWHDEMLVMMSYLSGVLSIWNKEGVLLREIGGGPSGSIIQMNVINECSYFIGGIMSLHQVTVKRDNNIMIRNDNLSFLSLTGCGLALNESQITATGDFIGNVFLWEHSKRLPVTQFTIASSTSVRCLVWVNNVLLIGSLSGEIFYWDSVTSKECKMLYHLIDGVVTIRKSRKNNQIAVGTTGGDLYVFQISHQSLEGFDIEDVWQSQVHKPKQQSDGSLLKMEIWSLMWSVDDEFIATASEDQTTVISNATNGTKITTLTGHTTAVTAVDWKILSSGKHVLSTCADDRTIRIYDGVTFDLIHVLNTYGIYGWHTLTYLCICQKKELLIVSTQNGYLVVWDLKNNYKCKAKWKMHSGSIEGLALTSDEKSIFTIGSDCVVNRFSLANF